MPRIKQFLDCVEDLRSLSIKDIKRYLKPNTSCDNAVLSYYRAGLKTGSISIESEIEETQGIIILDYKYREKERVTEVNLLWLNYRTP